MKDAGPGGPTGHPGYLRKRTRVKDRRGSLGRVGAAVPKRNAFQLGGCRSRRDSDARTRTAGVEAVCSPIAKLQSCAPVEASRAWIVPCCDAMYTTPLLTDGEAL
jgi:hypothetical protein